MHGVAEAGSVRASQWLRREHAAYLATPLLALGAWLSENIKKSTRKVSSLPDYRVSLHGLGYIQSKYDEARDRICARNGRSLQIFHCQAISYAVEFVSRKRPFSTEAQIGLSHAVDKGLFRLNVFRLRIPTGGSSRKTRLFRLDPPVEKLSQKSFTRVFSTDRIAYPTTKHTPTRPHGHTPIPGTTLQCHVRR